MTAFDDHPSASPLRRRPGTPSDCLRSRVIDGTASVVSRRAPAVGSTKATSPGEGQPRIHDGRAARRARNITVVDPAAAAAAVRTARAGRTRPERDLVFQGSARRAATAGASRRDAEATLFRMGTAIRTLIAEPVAFGTAGVLILLIGIAALSGTPRARDAAVTPPPGSIRVSEVTERRSNTRHASAHLFEKDNRLR
ncbi:hypothetical protein [Mangrovicella endophytica]|uniref:hypothetical protein n=1 Tax=Mangrovicella endophytica TaxID=2066697 RepID=UPI000C9E1CF4|nr:hypothetical protein [Mangrovicella endophytica]